MRDALVIRNSHAAWWFLSPLTTRSNEKQVLGVMVLVVLSAGVPITILMILMIAYVPTAVFHTGVGGPGDGDQDC